jgi:hypothetical protein
MDLSQLSDPQIITFMQDPKIRAILLLLATWEFVWKGIALWKAAKNDSRNWFIFILILNTVGILPIVYIFFFANKKKKTHQE